MMVGKEKKDRLLVLRCKQLYWMKSSMLVIFAYGILLTMCYIIKHALLETKKHSYWYVNMEVGSNSTPQHKL